MKEFLWYLTLPLNRMGSSNMLTTFDLDNDMILGLYYLMEIYHLRFYHIIYGSWEWISLSQGEDGEYLSGDQIKELEPDVEKFNKHKSNFEKGILPEGYVKANNLEPKKPEQEEFQYKGKFGWLSPTGEFVVSDWGEHEGSAYDIICEKGFEEEYDKWSDSDDSGRLELARDYLCEVKGWVLIHNPSMDGGYIVTNLKPMTKKQKEFLYSYFMEIGNGVRASMYIED
jgi:hypothetical protein